MERVLDIEVRVRRHFAFCRVEHACFSKLRRVFDYRARTDRVDCS